MTVLHQIDPVALQLGPVAIHWYGSMYLLFYGMLGVVLGGRLGYIFFYNFGEFLQNPSMLLRIWEVGMSVA